MKRSTLFSFILPIVISMCFFSSAIFAGEGDKPDGDEFPWDADGMANDTGSIYVQNYSRTQVPDSDVKPIFSYSLSQSFTTWLYYQVPIFKRFEIIERTTFSKRGSYRTDKLIK